MIGPATPGNGSTVTLNELLVPVPQALYPTTVIIPEMADVLKSVMAMLFGFVDVAPEGNVQVYPVTFAIAGIE